MWFKFEEVPLTMWCAEHQSFVTTQMLDGRFTVDTDGMVDRVELGAHYLDRKVYLPLAAGDSILKRLQPALETYAESNDGVRQYIRNTGLGSFNQEHRLSARQLGITGTLARL